VEAEGGEAETLAGGYGESGRERDGRKKGMPTLCNVKNGPFPPLKFFTPTWRGISFLGRNTRRVLVTINQQTSDGSIRHSIIKHALASEAPIYSIQIRQLQPSAKPPPAVKHTTASPPSLVVPPLCRLTSSGPIKPRRRHVLPNL
jgi:hypothetical protein